MTRTMEWYYDKKSKIEDSKIIFEIDGKKYIDSHTFKIFSIDEIKQCCEMLALLLKSI